MGDEQDGHIKLALKVFEQIDYLGLNGYIQSGCGLIGNEQIRIIGQGHGDHGALALPPGQFVGVGTHALAGILDADQFKQFQGSLTGVGFAETLVQQEDLVYLPFDGVQRVEGRHGLLENHADPVASQRLNLIVSRPQCLYIVNVNRTAGMGCLGIRQQAQYGVGRNGFAGAAFTHQRYGLAPVNFQRDLFNGMDNAIGSLEVNGQVLDF
jgi:hypothetical protein